ncbi:hypothetical protein SOVF_209490, partial [Spinacia oleracea]
MEGFEVAGISVIHGPTDTPLYSNMVQGLPDRYSFQNVRVNFLVLGLEAEVGGDDDNNGRQPDDSDYTSYGSGDDGGNGGVGGPLNLVFQNGDMHVNEANMDENQLCIKGQGVQNGPVQRDFVHGLPLGSDDGSYGTFSGSEYYASVDNNSKISFDWHHKRRKMEMTKWKFKGGFNRWVKCKGPTSLKEKCVTNTTMSTDLGVELSSFGSFEVNASKRKRSKEQLSPIFCKRSKANIASPSSSVGLKDS